METGVARVRDTPNIPIFLSSAIVHFSIALFHCSNQRNWVLLRFQLVSVKYLSLPLLYSKNNFRQTRKPNNCLGAAAAVGIFCLDDLDLGHHLLRCFVVEMMRDVILDSAPGVPLRDCWASSKPVHAPGGGILIFEQLQNLLVHQRRFSTDRLIYRLISKLTRGPIYQREAIFPFY